MDYELEVTCQKSLDNITSNTDLPTQLKTIFPTSPPTVLPPKTIENKPNLQSNQTIPSSVHKTILPKCGGVRRSAALDNIFGENIIALFKYHKSPFIKSNFSNIKMTVQNIQYL